MTVVRWFGLLSCALLGACGTLSNAGHEDRGDQNLPSAGVAPWDKVDLDGDATNLIQPWVLEVEPASDRASEPSAAFARDRIVLTYTRTGPPERSGIWRTEAPSPEELYGTGPGGRVLEASLAWEAGQVGAPALIFDEALGGAEPYRLWYEGGGGRGLGLASSPDGIRWAKHGAPVLVPDQEWEGGRVSAPTVVRVGDELWLWYEGGDGAGIGFATSRDGITWVKSGPGPVFTSALDWEGASTPDIAPGHVGSPSVILDASQSPPRFGLYYTGFVAVERNPLTASRLDDVTPGARNRSIGYAASTDGVHWTRADATMNPVVAEKTPLEIGEVPFPPELAAALPDLVLAVLRAVLGVDESGYPSLPALETVIDEGAPCVVGDGPDRFLMLFEQGNSLFVPLALELPPSVVTTPLGILVPNTRIGLALARSRR
ncbi:MAG: hypothetical protein IPK07_33470 [Deltaproteobacteria bacterium]|nr:hypothetical protein [Deltaproteobacteria bacterium]